MSFRFLGFGVIEFSYGYAAVDASVRFSSRVVSSSFRSFVESVFLSVAGVAWIDFVVDRRAYFLDGVG